MVVVIDSQVGGISGDMLLCSLVDMGADASRIADGVQAALEFYGAGAQIKRLEFGRTVRCGISAACLESEIEEAKRRQTGKDMLECVKKSCASLGLSAGASGFAGGSMESLIRAESRIHAAPPESVHFHEMSSFDTILDIVGTAVALDDLQIPGEQVAATPVSVGSGTVTFSHGTMSNPASAVLEILRGSKIAISGGPSGAEAATPTGAAMLVNLAGSCVQFYPQMEIEAVGYGAGRRDHEGFANVLKVARGPAVGAFGRDHVAVLETSVDDMSGEVAGHVIQRMMGAGALDAAVSPTTAKKGRPAHQITVMCDPGRATELAEMLIAETGTLGVRVRSSERIIAKRSLCTASVSLGSRKFEVRYKASEGAGTIKVESDDVWAAAEAAGMPFRAAHEAISAQIRGDRRSA